MESLDLTYKLIALKTKSKTLDRIYFMSQVFQEHSNCYDKRKKIRKWKLRKFIYFCCHPFPLRTGGCCTPPPHPPTFFTAKSFENIFHRYNLDKGWVNWPYGNLSKNAKTERGKIPKEGRGGGCNNSPPPLLRETVNNAYSSKVVYS